MKEIDTVGGETDENRAENKEGAPMRRSFSVEDLLDEVEKICYDASGSSKVEMVVRLWKDGFTVNDQEFRSYSVPENQDFLDSIKRGELPKEWESRAEEEELEISVEDLTEENYVPRKRAFHPFSGRGYRLGSVAPRVVARSPSVHEDGESPPIPMVTLDHALPVTSLQIWLADGRRLVQRFNLSNRIADVQDFVARCQRSCPPFVLTTSVPFRELDDKDLSLQEADLANAVIVQRPLDTQAPFGHC
ncbi:UBX domain-containing protein 2A isoform X1 [Cyclopterus lumpus]|uniref:UBX domain protein 2A n=1 Tax=Cyclopterus lumpus TaxID=8103 RepID=A0A8C3G1Z0_CYCLU|nr:UBX domain-containing protein 2A isoform X1 [Cyclopterus lumpus]XP_034383306.1 UBX domain-containing protein 2A isoform X1 [Cyclopterus lumpus]XP_034383308.1 UBX domain-containing protein 2A isoform X1 [Cyclopterus lumpus]